MDLGKGRPELVLCIGGHFPVCVAARCAGQKQEPVRQPPRRHIQRCRRCPAGCWNDCLASASWPLALGGLPPTSALHLRRKLWSALNSTNWRHVWQRRAWYLWGRCGQLHRNDVAADLLANVPLPPVEQLGLALSQMLCWVEEASSPAFTPLSDRGHHVRSTLQRAAPAHDIAAINQGGSKAKTCRCETTSEAWCRIRLFPAIKSGQPGFCI